MCALAIPHGPKRPSHQRRTKTLCCARVSTNVSTSLAIFKLVEGARGGTGGRGRARDRNRRRCHLLQGFHFPVSGKKAGKVTRLPEQKSAGMSPPEHSSRPGPGRGTRDTAPACESKTRAFAPTVKGCLRHGTRSENASTNGNKSQNICGYGWNDLQIHEYTWQYTFAFPARARAHTHALAEERTHTLAEGRTHIPVPLA